jgi:hypothetical protein
MKIGLLVPFLSAVQSQIGEMARPVAFYRLKPPEMSKSPDLLPDFALIAPVFPELAGNFSSMRSSRLRG